MRYYQLDYLRVFAIAAIVFFHTTGMLYADHFPDSKENYTNIYFVFNQCYLVNFAMVVFTALSGFLFAKLYDEGRYKSIRLFLSKKTKHLLLPFAFFTPLIISTESFNTRSFQDSIYKCLLSFYHGSFGHLWYLPCLFWCFVIAIFIYPKLKSRFAIQVITFLLALASCLALNKIEANFLGIVHTGRWFFFFLAGILLACHHKKLQNKDFIHYVLLIGVIISCCLHPFLPYAELDVIIALTLFVSLIPIFHLTERYLKKPLFLISTISKYSYGIYIFHCWIAPFLISSTTKRLFYIDSFADQHVYIFPCLLFLLVLFLSYTITYFFQKTRLGKFLLG